MKTLIKTYGLTAVLLVAFTSEGFAQSRRSTSEKKVVTTTNKRSVQNSNL